MKKTVEATVCYPICVKITTNITDDDIIDNILLNEAEKILNTSTIKPVITDKIETEIDNKGENYENVDG